MPLWRFFEQDGLFFARSACDGSQTALVASLCTWNFPNHGQDHLPVVRVGQAPEQSTESKREDGDGVTVSVEICYNDHLRSYVKRYMLMTL